MRTLWLIRTITEERERGKRKIDEKKTNSPWWMIKEKRLPCYMSRLKEERKGGMVCGAVHVVLKRRPPGTHAGGKQQ